MEDNSLMAMNDVSVASGFTGMEGNTHQLTVGGNGSFDGVGMNNFHRSAGRGDPSQGYLHDYSYSGTLLISTFSNFTSLATMDASFFCAVCGVWACY